MNIIAETLSNYPTDVVVKAFILRFVEFVVAVAVIAIAIKFIIS